VACGRTDSKGRALLAFDATRGTRSFVVVGEQRTSSPGAFRLRAQPAEPAEHAPGHAMRRGSVRDSVNGLTDVNDIWWTRLHRGITYRIAFSSTPCATASLRARGRVVRLACGAHTAFTPGRDGGGRYSIEVRAGSSPRPQRYRLRIAKAGPDDVGIGVGLRPGSSARGSLAPGGVDVLDLYHFDVQRPSEARLRLTQAPGRSFTLTLLTDTGGRVDGGSAQIRRRLGPGRYVVAVQAVAGTPGGRYRLSVRLRDLTSTSVLVSGRSSTEVRRGSSVALRCVVTPAASGGRVELEIDRFDPLTGWHFHRLVRAPLGTTVSWRPPAAGRWRVRARYLGSSRSAPSRSGYAQIVVI
ncbi:MAG TPA: hypothetical protein VFO03_03680, partial [Gaiellaceae bacterium]|nr:hypothetical protein [Gaiellaceae bacterium]